jgi:nucleoside-diphosphate-sugar epimerase
VNRCLLENRQPYPLPAEYQKLRGSKLLVTGAAGFIGGALLKRLAEYECDVVGTVLLQEEAEQLRANGYRAEVLDLAGDEPWDSLLEGVDCVFHMAAMFTETEHGESMYRKVNVDGAVKLVQTAVRCGVQRFVHCSTVGVHGDVKEIPCRESSPFNPMDEYHRTKLDGELAIMDFASHLPSGGMVVTSNRPAMVYGPGDLRLLKLFKAVVSGRFRMIGSGKVLAHLGYIDDQVDSFLLCAVRPRDAVHLEAFNIASGRHITLNELVSTIADAARVRIPKTKIPVAPVWLAGLLCEIACRPFGVRPPIFRRRVGFFTHNRAFDLSKAKHKLGYVSKVGHEEGIRLMLDWYERQGLV